MPWSAEDENYYAKGQKADAQSKRKLIRDNPMDQCNRSGAKFQERYHRSCLACNWVSQFVTALIYRVQRQSAQ